MKTILVLLALCASVLSAQKLGTNAPSIPATYATSHPHMSAPTTAQVNAIWAARPTAEGGTNGAAYMWTDASGWNNVAPGTAYRCRHLILATWAEELNGGANAAAFLALVEGFEPNASAWSSGVGPYSEGWCDAMAYDLLYPYLTSTDISNLRAAMYQLMSGTSYSITAGSWAGGTATITIANAAPFVSGQLVSVASVNPAGYICSGCVVTGVTGTTISYAVASNPGAYVSGGTATGVLGCAAGGNEALFYISGSTLNSPWSDTNYTRMCVPEFEMAMAIYPDDPTNSISHLRWALDKWTNYDMPAYKHTMSGNRGIQTTDGSSDNGGGWINGWGDYQGPVNQVSMTQHFMTDALNWAVASGIGTANLFVSSSSTYPWMKNFAYWLPYELRPDWMLNDNVAITFAPMDPESSTYGAHPGYLNETAAIYNDQTLRCIARTINGLPPSPFLEPSAYPYYTPDSTATNTTCPTGHQWLGATSSLAPYKNFPGWGMINVRTGFTEGDTSCWIEYSPSFWDHPINEAGAFNCDHRGQLAINAGTYIAGSGSDEWQMWGAQGISHNMPLLNDPNDYYGMGGAGGNITSATEEEYWGWCRNFPGAPPYSTCPSGMTFAAPQNDGGQRHVGSAIGNQHFTWSGSAFVNSVGNVSAVQGEPSDEPMWNRTREWYHMGTLSAYAVGTNNAYMAAFIDTTAAYNNTFSHNAFSTSSLFNSYTDNTTNRTARANSVTRGFVFIPIGGTSAVLMVYDQITLNPSNIDVTSIVKQDLIHTINQPTIGTPSSGSTPFSVSRTETVTESDGTTWLSDGCPHLANCNGGHTTYTYGGQMLGWLTSPAASGSTNCASGNFSCLTNVGGPGSEFAITDGTGTRNHNECMLGLCGGLAGIAGSVSAANWTFTTGTNDQLVVAADTFTWPSSGASNVPSASWTGGTATITLSPVTLTLQSGGLISIKGASPTGYNCGNCLITAVTSTTVSYAVTSNPGAYSANTGFATYTGPSQTINLTAGGLCTSGSACTCTTAIGGGSFGSQLTGATATCPLDPFTGNPRIAVTSNNTTLLTAQATIYSASANATLGFSGALVAGGTYTSGITATGAMGSFCFLSSINGGGSGGLLAVFLTGTNTIASGASLSLQAAGVGYTTNPTSATATNGSGATCSGTATISGLILGQFGCAALGGHACYVNGLGGNADFMHPSNVTGPAQPGSWTMYETVGQYNLTDQFLNLLLFQDSGTSQMTTAPATTTVTTGTGACNSAWAVSCKVTTFSTTVAGNSCNYTVTLPIGGMEGYIQASNAGGSGCLNVL
jgi:hypothetical protein